MQAKHVRTDRKKPRETIEYRKKRKRKREPANEKVFFTFGRRPIQAANEHLAVEFNASSRRQRRRAGGRDGQSVQEHEAVKAHAITTG